MSQIITFFPLGKFLQITMSLSSSGIDYVNWYNNIRIQAASLKS